MVSSAIARVLGPVVVPGRGRSTATFAGWQVCCKALGPGARGSSKVPRMTSLAAPSGAALVRGIAVYLGAIFAGALMDLSLIHI